MRGIGRILGIDVGATNLKVGIFNIRGRHMLHLLTERTDHARLLAQLDRIIWNAPHFDSIGMALPGLLDKSARVWQRSPNIRSVKDLKLAQILERRHGTKVALSNDAVAAVMGEREFGVGGRSENLVYITLSTGIGAGAIVDGRVLTGKGGGAHEAGHSTVDMNAALRCSCGSYGHWEAYCSGNGIPNFARLLLRTKLRGMVPPAGGRRLTAKAIFDASQTNTAARAIVEEIGRVNAIGFANVTNMYDPELIAVGGGIALANPGLVLGPIRSHIGKYCFNDAPRIVQSKLGEHASLYGAVVPLVGRRV